MIAVQVSRGIALPLAGSCYNNCVCMPTETRATRIIRNKTTALYEIRMLTHQRVLPTAIFSHAFRSRPMADHRDWG